MECQHEKFLVPVNENALPPLDDSWDLMSWADNSVKVNMCKKCHLLYWENKK